MRLAAACGEGQHQLRLSSLVRIDGQWVEELSQGAWLHQRLDQSRPCHNQQRLQGIHSTTCTIFGKKSSELIPLYVDPFQAATHVDVLVWVFANNQGRLSDLTTWTISCAGSWHCSRESNQPCWVPPKGEARAEWVDYSYISSPLNFVHVRWWLIRFKNLIKSE